MEELLSSFFFYLAGLGAVILFIRAIRREMSIKRCNAFSQNAKESDKKEQNKEIAAFLKSRKSEPS